MTYAGFLLLFLVVPILLLTLALRHRLQRRHALSLLALMAIALVYTTPWDNYLVANEVWWYDTGRVVGIRLGWVPLEEYLFFLLQPLFTGLLFLGVTRNRDGADDDKGKGRMRPLLLSLVPIWGASLLLPSGPESVRYLSLELAWGLPPLLLQLLFGGDLLWRQRRSIFLTLGLATTYLVAADVVAIRAGIWTISPQFTLLPPLFGGLVFEEVIFFLLTNTLVVFGVGLLVEPEAHARIQSVWADLTRHGALTSDA